MTPQQFDALSTLLRMQPTRPSREAARLVLVESLSGAEAARRLGLTPPAARRAVNYFRSWFDAWSQALSVALLRREGL